MKKKYKVLFIILLLFIIACVIYYCMGFHAEKSYPDEDLLNTGYYDDLEIHTLNVPIDMAKMPLSDNDINEFFDIKEYPYDLSPIIEGIKRIDNSFDESKYGLEVGSNYNSNPAYEMYFEYLIGGNIITNKCFIVTVFENNAWYIKAPKKLLKSDKNSLENEKSLIDLVNEFKESKEYLRHQGDNANIKQDDNTVNKVKSRSEYFYYDYYEDVLYYQVELNYYEELSEGIYCMVYRTYLRGEGDKL